MVCVFRDLPVVVDDSLQMFDFSLSGMLPYFLNGQGVCPVNGLLDIIYTSSNLHSSLHLAHTLFESLL
jgi:hypothetical protein